MAAESPPLVRDRSNWRTITSLVLITLLAFGLRLLRLDEQSLWIDETISAYLASLTPGEIIVDRHRLQLDREYAGPAALLVGMYDLTNMERLAARDCRERPLSNDSVHLTDVSIEGQR